MGREYAQGCWETDYAQYRVRPGLYGTCTHFALVATEVGQKYLPRMTVLPHQEMFNYPFLDR